MKAVRNVVIGVAVVFFAAMIAGLMMPSRFTVERSRTIAAPPESLFLRFATPRTWPEWSAWSPAADSTVRFSYEGPAGGAGATMKWTARRMGGGTLRITEAIAPSSVRYEVNVAETPVVVRGSVALAPDGAGTRVTWRDEGDVGGNPLVRLLLPLMHGSLGNAFEIGFGGLERTLGPPGGAPPPGAPRAAAARDSSP